MIIEPRFLLKRREGHKKQKAVAQALATVTQWAIGGQSLPILGKRGYNKALAIGFYYFLPPFSTVTTYL